MEEIKELLDLSPHLELTTPPYQKIKCKLTGHEMPPQIDRVKEYLAGHKYRVALQREAVNFNTYSPCIIAHKTNPNLLYCTVTHRAITKLKSVLEKHIHGRNYKRLLKEQNRLKRSKINKILKSVNRRRLTYLSNKYRRLGERERKLMGYRKCYSRLEYIQEYLQILCRYTKQ